MVEAVADISTRIGGGEFVCVIGPSGHGKSTLLHLIAGLLLPTDGEVVVGGVTVRGPGPDRGVVFQTDSVFPWMRVIDNVEYGLKCRRVPREIRQRIAAEYLEAVGLTHVARSWPRELSGGMLKRVAVATAFANGAGVLLLDEPFGPLDYVTRRTLHGVLLSLWDRGDDEANSVDDATPGRRTIIFVTHDVDEALTLGDRIIVVKHGRLIEDLSVPDARPRTDDDLAQPEMLHRKHILLHHLGLES